MRKLTFIILCLEGAVLSFNVAACAALIPSIAGDFGVEFFVAGRIVWLYMLPYGVAALFYGPLANMFDAKRIELVCFFLFSAANLLAALSPTLDMLFLARFLMGIFGASVVPLILILIGHSVEAKNRGKLVGIFFSATFVASLAGLFSSGIMPWRMIFLIPAIIGFIVWLLMYLWLPSCVVQRSSRKIPYMTVLRDKTIISIFAYIFFVSLFYHGIQQWLSVYFAATFSMNQFLISMLITLTSLSGIFGEAIGGWLSDILGRRKTADVGIALMIISAFLLLVKSPLAILVLLMLVWGLGWTFNHAGISAALTDLPKNMLNEAASLNSGVRFIAGACGVVFSGWLMHKSFMLGFITLGSGLAGLLFTSRYFVVKT
ncbi:MAG: MFS transporter [Candidatus Omnitrophota bacterium]